MKNQNSNGRRGLLSGGNWIVDQVKLIDVYPQPEQLGNIRSQAQGTGGAPYNVLVDLAKTGVPFPLFAAGLVGQDTLAARIWIWSAPVRASFIWATCCCWMLWISQMRSMGPRQRAF